MSSENVTERRHRIICLVTDGEVIDRSPGAVRYLQVGLIDEPFDIVLVAPDNTRAATIATGPTTLITYRPPSWPFAGFARKAAVAKVVNRLRQIEGEKTLLVHCLSVDAAPLAAGIAAATQADMILNVASASALEREDWARCMQRAAALVAPAEGIRQALRESRLAARAAEIIHLGVMTGSAPAAFSHPENATTVIYSGGLSHEAGVDLLLRAARRVLRSHPTLQVFIVGKGPAESELRQLANGLDISLNVTFTGRLKNPRVAMEASDIFCMPRAQRGFCEEPIHALACGLAVIAPIGVFCDGLIDRQTALLFPDHDEHLLAQRIMQYVEDPESARSIAATGQAYARSNYAVSGMVSGYTQLYHELASRRETIVFADR